MSKKLFVKIVVIVMPMILFLNHPLPSQAESCLAESASRCCTLNSASCQGIGTAYPAGDATCASEWTGAVGKVCCVGERAGNPWGRCKNDASLVPGTVADVPVKLAEKSLPKFNSLITADSKTFIANIIKGLLGLAGTLTIIMMVYGGILWMTAAGNDKAVAKAKQIMIWTVIGLALIFSSYAILSFIFTSLGATT